MPHLKHFLGQKSSLFIKLWWLGIIQIRAGATELVPFKKILPDVFALQSI